MTKTAAIQWPDPGETAYIYKDAGPGAKRQRFYANRTRGWERPGVTTIIDAAYGGGKEHLIRWAANLERVSTLTAAGLAWEELRKTHAIDAMSGEHFAVHVENALGKARSHERAKEKAGDIGKAAHEMVQWTLRKQLGLPVGPEPTLTDESSWAFMSWADRWKTAGITPVAIEQPIWSDTHDYAGTIDLIGERDGKLGIVDLKSSKYVYDSGHLQVAAYMEAANEWLYSEYGAKGRGFAQHEIEWAELWSIPKTTERTETIIVPLGKIYDRTLTRAELWASFDALRVVFQNLCRAKE